MNISNTKVKRKNVDLFPLEYTKDRSFEPQAMALGFLKTFSSFAKIQ